jgi:peptidoglycan/xylan/chitin deacetylase (PgdA/CDA1 family)
MQCVRPDGHIAIRFETTVNSAGETGREARMPGLTVALYHAIVPSESSFERGLGIATRPEVFEAQIAHLAKNYDVVDLDTVLSGKLPRRPLLITFDDFYASVLTFAKSVLKPRGLPSVFFVNPDIVGRDAIGLDNVIAFCVNRFGIKAVCEAANLGSQSISSIDDLIEGPISQMSAAKRTELKALLLENFSPGAEDFKERNSVIDAADLAECATLGIEIGNHTATHVHCGALRPTELRTEIAEARLKLEAMSGSTVRAFSVPYGSERDLTAPVLEAIRESGHKAIFLVHGRSNISRMAPDIWYRTSLHNEKPSDLFRKLTIFPLLRTVKQHLFK